MTELILFNKQTLILWEFCFYSPQFLRVYNPIFIHFNIQNNWNFHTLVFGLVQFEFFNGETWKKNYKNGINSSWKILVSLTSVSERNKGFKRVFFSFQCQNSGDQKGNCVTSFCFATRACFITFQVAINLGSNGLACQSFNWSSTRRMTLWLAQSTERQSSCSCLIHQQSVRILGIFHQGEAQIHRNISFMVSCPRYQNPQSYWAPRAPVKNTVFLMVYHGHHHPKPGIQIFKIYFANIKASVFKTQTVCLKYFRDSGVDLMSLWCQGAKCVTGTGAIS